jgi:hypothetical protein
MQQWQKGAVSGASALQSFQTQPENIIQDDHLHDVVSRHSW